MGGATRRDFLKAGLAAGILGGTGGLLAEPAAGKSASDWVMLGKSGVKVTRLGMGTGTYNGRAQRELGQEGFTRVVRHAYERGVRFFDTAETYSGMPQMLAKALKGLPRDSYRLMSKFEVGDKENPKPTIERLRQELDAEYLDIMLMHCMRSPGWPEELKGVQDALSEAKARQSVLAHGASIHGLLPLRACPGNQWLDVALLRMNHRGASMDTLKAWDSAEPGNVEEVAAQSRKIHAQGTGVVGMKLIGEGRFKTPEERDAAMKFVLGLGSVDAVIIGFQSTAEVDEAIERMNRTLKA
jgi:hypothetical protein